jgi:catechol 2,3-dioxygenase-like lactoylglutathione lyase family enzyme
MIQHVSREIPPSLLPDCVAFYSLLGFEPVEVPAGLQGRAVWLGWVGSAGDRSLGLTEAGREPGSGGPTGTQLHLMLVDDARPATGHVAFVVDAYDATVARLREAGFEVEPRREHWGAPRAYVRDPASNLVELMAWAPGESRE